jgi:hypothetical protein
MAGTSIADAFDGNSVELDQEAFLTTASAMLFGASA